MEGSEARQAPCEFPVTTNGQLALSYTPALIREGKNSKLEYRAELADETGRSITYTFAHEFANRVEVYTPKGTSSDQVTAANALDRTSTPEKAIVWCYEGGCDLTITGERFDGWYADATFTQKLSAAQTFRYVPTQAESRIYTKFRQPEPKIQCHETAKNATYMNNVNTVDLTVEDYTGPVVVKAFCEQGGVVTAGAEQTVTVESGNRITLSENIVFVPTKTGEVSYVIEVYLSDGTKIGTTTITNTITATKLTPKIRLYYANFYPEREVTDPNIGTPTKWGGYNDVYADVTFIPELDYATPLEGKQLLKIQLEAIECYAESFNVIDSQYGTDPWVIEVSYGSYAAPPLNPITALYPESLAQSIIKRADIATYFGGWYFEKAILAPELPYISSMFWDFDPDFLDPVKGRPFLWIEMGDPITASQISITKLYTGTDLQLETNFTEIRNHIVDNISYGR